VGKLSCYSIERAGRQHLDASRAPNEGAARLFRAKRLDMHGRQRPYGLFDW
jgi:hypothetical protein